MATRKHRRGSLVDVFLRSARGYESNGGEAHDGVVALAVVGGDDMRLRQAIPGAPRLKRSCYESRYPAT
jgi:hypothetical protein